MNLFCVYVCDFIIIFSTLIYKSGANNDTDIDYSFPDGFLIGTASAAFQVEGAWNESGKSESVWDYFAHNYPSKIADQSNGDVACVSYHKFKEDIQLMKDIGINHYRFSLSWARILPTGYANNINQEGLRYYHNILDEVQKHGMEAFVTLYHWDHPQSLERLGGWMNDLMAELFADYARIIFKEFGPRVKFFSTINEPYVYCVQGYRTTEFAPGLNLSNWGEYICMHNMLKAHTHAYHIYDNEFRSKQNGQVGLVTPCWQHYSKNKNDSESAEIAFEFNCGWTANPIFSKEGDYPELMKRKIAEISKLEERRKSKLPTFTTEEINYIRGTADYFGLNHYTSYLVEPSPEVNEDTGLLFVPDPQWISSQSDWLKIVPKGFGDILRKIKEKYNNPPLYVMENGVSDADVVNDNNRILYLHGYMKEMLIAMKRDNCNIKAYTVWSFSDSFEWSEGYTNNFGLVRVDFNDPNRMRTPKKSVSWLKSVLQTRKLQPYE